MVVAAGAKAIPSEVTLTSEGFSTLEVTMGGTAVVSSRLLEPTKLAFVDVFRTASRLSLMSLAVLSSSTS